MTLSQIIAQALRQLDEDAEDVSEYEESFRVYANMGYDIAVREYLKPRRIFYTEVDEEGNAPVPGLTVVRVIELRDDLAGQTLRAVCEVAFYPLEDGQDEPQLPEYAHAALADYICYRHLSSGNLAKQSRAQFYQTSFYQAMQRIRPEGMGSVTRFRNLYEVTDARYCK